MSMTPTSPRSNFVWKGKAKASEPSQDFDDLNPEITYRHILSNNLGVRDPLRVIALCDSDAFYAACEMNRLGVDPETPLVVLQWDSLIAVNYPARKFGVSRMDKKKDALKRCPHLQVVHVATYKEGEKEPGYWDDVDTNTHKVSLDHYRRESLKIAAMFKEQLPDCEIEKASIDEAFFDFTKPVREILLQRYPYLAQVPSEGIDTPLPPPPPLSWDGLGNLIPVNPPPSSSPDEPKSSEGQSNDGNEVESDDKILSEDSKHKASAGEENIGLNPEHPKPQEETKHVEELQATWHDVALSIAAELMGKAREEVRVKMGYSTSAGISRNKFLAKLSASYKKPNNQSILRNAAIPNYLKPMQFQKIRFLGGKLGDALAKEYDASTVGDLLTISLDEMQSKFGESSLWIYEVLRGIDRNEVKDKGSTLNKSMLASKNLPKPITKASEGHHWIRVLAAELALRLNDARKVSPNIWPKTIVLHARKGYEAGRSKQSPFPFHREVTVDVIAAAGDRLWKELVGNSSKLNVSSVQLAFTGIDQAEAGQRSIEGFLSKPSSSKKRPRDHDSDVEVGETPKVPVVTSVADIDRPYLNDLPQVASSFSCARCGKTIQLPTVANQSGPLDMEEELAKLKMEHEDFHFAQELANEGNSRPALTVSEKKTTKTTNKKKARPEAVGIERFFHK